MPEGYYIFPVFQSSKRAMRLINEAPSALRTTCMYARLVDTQQVGVSLDRWADGLTLIFAMLVASYRRRACVHPCDWIATLIGRRPLRGTLLMAPSDNITIGGASQSLPPAHMNISSPWYWPERSPCVVSSPGVTALHHPACPTHSYRRCKASIPTTARQKGVHLIQQISCSSSAPHCCITTPARHM